MKYEIERGEGEHAGSSAHVWHREKMPGHLTIDGNVRNINKGRTKRALGILKNIMVVHHHRSVTSDD